MARIKAEAPKEKNYALTDPEFHYIQRMHEARQKLYEEQGQVIAAFMKYVAGSRLGYKPDADLKFELDFKDDKHNLIITKLQVPLKDPE